jgi:hydroxymethylglutaryl-CoA reductase (NADPH)
VSDRIPIPRDPANDYTADMARQRREFVTGRTGTALTHVGSFTVDPAQVAGNVENFLGVAQVPIGLAGPLRINGEHASGDFYVPLATTEGTLVASYSRGMRLLTENGGVTVTVVKRSMQRAPVFEFPSAREARDFGQWLVEQFGAICAAAESTTRIGKLTEIEQYAVGNQLFTRFNYTTGDAAGQNMTGKATLAACEWIRSQHPLHPAYMLSGSIDTDKKHSAINTLRTRGRRVIAEVTLRNETLQRLMRVDARTLFRARQISQAGSFMAGSAYNGPHAANGIAAMFIATGQDVANVAESHAGITYAQLLENGDYYWSVTLPSLIVASYGGGTGLGTQRECLEMLGCYGPGKADRLAEIVAAVVLAGDVSLGSAVLAGDWVSSHDKLGRNRP